MWYSYEFNGVYIDCYIESHIVNEFCEMIDYESVMYRNIKHVLQSIIIY